MVRFSRLRTRSRATGGGSTPTSQESFEDASRQLLPARQTLRYSQPQPQFHAKSLVDLKRLQSKEARYVEEDLELEDLLRKINENEQNADNLNITVGLLKQRTSSTKSSSSGNEENNDSLTKAEPLWKRRLSRVRSSKKDTPKETSSSDPAPTSSSSSDVNKNKKQPQEEKAVAPPKQVEQTVKRPKATKMYAVDEAPRAPVGMPSVIYSVVKAQPSEDRDEYATQEQSYGYTSTGSVSDDTPSVLKENRHYDKRYHSREFNGADDSVSSLGRDDDGYFQGSQCSVSSLASDALRGTALLLLQCNDRCVAEPHHTHRRRRHSNRRRQGD